VRHEFHPALVARVCEGEPGRVQERPREPLHGANVAGHAHDRPVEAAQPELTANRILTILKAALNHAFANGRTANDAEWRRVKPFKGVDGARQRFLDPAESRRLVNACDADFKLMVQAALLTGCRYSELCRLRGSDFDADAGTIYIGKSKTDKQRHVHLNDEGIAFFETVTAGKAGNAHVFTRADGTEWKDGHQKRRMDEACRLGRVEPRCVFHELRHSYASALVKASIPLAVVAEQIGDSEAMVRHHYGHLAPSHVANVIRELSPKYRFKPASNVAKMRRKRA